MALPGAKDSFKWKSGVASSTDSSTKVLLFKIDPADSAGAGIGPEIISKQFTYFGTYSARLKVPNVRDVQPNTGAVVGYFTYYMDSVYGLSEIDFEWLVADPTIVYIGTWTGFEGHLKRIGRADKPGYRHHLQYHLQRRIYRRRNAINGCTKRTCDLVCHSGL